MILVNGRHPTTMHPPYLVPPRNDTAQYALYPDPHHLLSPSRSLSMLIMWQDHHNHIFQRLPGHHSTSRLHSSRHMHLLNLSSLPTSLVRHFLYPTSPNKPPLLPPFRSTNPCQYPSSPTLPHCLNNHQHPRFNPWLHPLLHKQSHFLDKRK
jgi:hypothetical protein